MLVGFFTSYVNLCAWDTNTVRYKDRKISINKAHIYLALCCILADFHSILINFDYSILSVLNHEDKSNISYLLILGVY